jgi:hypothetical protein
MAELREWKCTLTYKVYGFAKPVDVAFPGRYAFSYLFTLPTAVEIESKLIPDKDNIRYIPELLHEQGITEYELVDVQAEPVPRK